jgi:hypothetical protein
VCQAHSGTTSRHAEDQFGCGQTQFDRRLSSMFGSDITTDRDTLNYAAITCPMCVSRQPTHAIPLPPPL